MTETVAEFAARARDWLADSMPRLDPDNPPRVPVMMNMRGSAPANCNSCSMPVDSPGSAFPANTADSASTSPTRRPSMPKPTATRCH